MQLPDKIRTKVGNVNSAAPVVEQNLMGMRRFLAREVRTAAHELYKSAQRSQAAIGKGGEGRNATAGIIGT